MDKLRYGEIIDRLHRMISTREVAPTLEISCMLFMANRLAADLYKMEEGFIPTASNKEKMRESLEGLLIIFERIGILEPEGCGHQVH